MGVHEVQEQEVRLSRRPVEPGQRLSHHLLRWPPGGAEPAHAQVAHGPGRQATFEPNHERREPQVDTLARQPRVEEAEAAVEAEDGLEGGLVRHDRGRRIAKPRQPLRQRLDPIVEAARTAGRGGRIEPGAVPGREESREQRGVSRDRPGRRREALAVDDRLLRESGERRRCRRRDVHRAHGVQDDHDDVGTIARRGHQLAWPADRRAACRAAEPRDVARRKEPRRRRRRAPAAALGFPPAADAQAPRRPGPPARRTGRGRPGSPLRGSADG